MPTALWWVAKSTLTNCHITNFHISTFPLQTWQVYLILRAAQNFRTGPKNIHWLPNFFLKFLLPKLCFFGLFSFGVSGACISGLPSYLLAYILTNLHTHLLRIPIHLPIYLSRCRPLSSPTHNLGYQLIIKFASLQVCKYKKITKLPNYKT
jgi:hypothetical protein